MMTTDRPVRVLYFAKVRETVGADTDHLPMAKPTLVSDCLKTLSTFSSAHAAGLENTHALRFAVNHKLVEKDAVVHPGDEIAIFPPVTGG